MPRTRAPMGPYIPTGLPRDATPRQEKYLRSLIHERTDMDPEVVELWKDQGLLTFQFASDLITEYKELPVIHEAAPVEPGYYVREVACSKEYYLVVRTKDGKRTYAKRLVNSGNAFSWEYDRGAVSTLHGLVPLSAQEAAKWGKLHGRCIHCFRSLSTPESVERGYGPVCAKVIEGR